MDLETQEAPKGREIVIILPDRSRDIIRLFEELQRKRRQGGLGSTATILGNDRLIIAAIVFSIGFAGLAVAELIRPMPPQRAAVSLAAEGPVRIVGPAFVPNIKPSEH
ncbi:MAG: hypothetical protein E7813_25350 [Bradyrhizobium sp.]|uniref:hypothetical protein n=1 Tax=Bradyrhizobium sp. TaxID=376 RepID=UPI00122B6EBA|nr:hypothetical protein [Bradyrhizobium sp.]THD59231.1 MAG: hypothetical protein E7813_25350 [Bradyrhizobium sp.]